MRIFASCVAGSAPIFLHAGYASAGPPLIPDVFLESVGSSLLWIVALLAVGFLFIMAAWLARVFLEEFCGGQGEGRCGREKAQGKPARRRTGTPAAAFRGIAGPGRRAASSRRRNGLVGTPLPAPDDLG